MFKTLRFSLFFAVAICLCLQGCAISDSPYHLVCGGSDSCSHEQMQNAVRVESAAAIFNNGWKTCLRGPLADSLKGEPLLINDTRCKDQDKESLLPISYAQAWMEYGDSGERQELAQRQAIIDWIGHGTGPLHILVYIHGWHNNADQSNGDPRNNAIKFPLLMARQVDTLKRMSLANNTPMPQVLGIYVGWRGEAYKDPIRQFFTVGGRAEAADTIGRKGDLKADLMAIADAMRMRSLEQGRMIVMGHSFGGRILTSTFMDELVKKNPQPLGEHTLIVTLNAAVGADCYDGVFEENGSNPDKPQPTWINITSEDDAATKTVYPTARAFHLIPACHPSSPAKYNTIGHYYDYLRQVIDQAVTLKEADKFDAEVVNKAQLSEPEWYKQPKARIFMKFPARTETALNLSQSYITSVNVGLNDDKLPSRVFGRGVWNVRSDKSLIDFDVDGDTINSYHNGYVSTVLVRLLTEVSYPPRN